MRGRVMTNQVFKYGENVLPVLNDFFQHGSKFRSAHGFLVPLGEHGRGNLYVAAELIGGMAAEKQAVEKGRLALRELKVLQGLFHRIGHRCHERNRSLPISMPTSRVHERKSTYMMRESATWNRESGT